MKKLWIVVVFVGVLVLGMGGLTSKAGAVSFTNTVNFNGGGYTTITDDYTYTHDINGIPAGAVLNSATLTIRHEYNSNSTAELWFVENNIPNNPNDIYIGQLANSASGWIEDPFILPQAVLDSIMNHDWELRVTLYDNTSGYDYLHVDWSKLEGEYNSVPEPSILILLGSGLLGLVGLRKSRKQ